MIVIDACGAGELPDAADYGDAGTNTLGTSPRPPAGSTCPVLQAARARRHPAARRRAAVAAAASSTAACTRSGPGKDTITGHWELMGVVTPRAAAHLPGRLPGGRSSSSCSDATGRGVLCNRPYSGTGGDRGLRRAAPRDRRPDRLHVGGLGAADRRARRRGPARRAVRGLRRGARDHVGRARRRPRDRAAVPRRARRVRAHRRPQGPRAPAARRAPTWTSCSPPACPCTRSARSVRCSTASASTSSTRAPTNAAALTATAELIDTLDGGFVFTNLVETDQVYGHRNDVPGYHGALQGDRRRGRGVARAPGPGARPADHHRRPRLRPDHARHRPHARARAAARALRGPRRAAPRRSVRGRRRLGPASGSPAATRRFPGRRSSKPPNLRPTGE